MLNEPTTEKLKALRLAGLLDAWVEQQKNPEIAALGFDERLGLLIDAEWINRENKRISRSLKEAKLRITEASIEGIDYPAKRELDKAVIRQLQTCRWVQEHQSILITGATGTGKSYIACALANQACRKGFRAIYRRAVRLFDELKIARADGTYRAVLSRLARVEVLVLDDFGVQGMGDAERNDLLEVLEDRYGLRSTIVTSQLPISSWHEYLSDPTLADAICDRLVNNAHRLALKGPSRRRTDQTNQEP
jgi:DNA replication protein DnaC